MADRLTRRVFLTPPLAHIFLTQRAFLHAARPAKMAHRLTRRGFLGRTPQLSLFPAPQVPPARCRRAYEELKAHPKQPPRRRAEGPPWAHPQAAMDAFPYTRRSSMAMLFTYTPKQPLMFSLHASLLSDHPVTFSLHASLCSLLGARKKLASSRDIFLTLPRQQHRCFLVTLLTRPSSH